MHLMSVKLSKVENLVIAVDHSIEDCLLGGRVIITQPLEEALASARV